MNSVSLTTNTTPRTVQQVRALDKAIAKHDALLDRAVMRGNLEASIRHDAQLRELMNLMDAVSDRLWGKYCEAEMLREEA